MAPKRLAPKRSAADAVEAPAAAAVEPSSPAVPVAVVLDAAPDAGSSPSVKRRRENGLPSPPPSDTDGSQSPPASTPPAAAPAAPAPSKLRGQSRIIQGYLATLADGRPAVLPEAAPAAPAAEARQFLVGTLVWAKVSKTSIWWPGRISYHPHSGQFQTQTKHHVQFFGPKPTHGWALKSLVCFLDEVTIEQVRAEASKRPPRQSLGVEAAYQQAAQQEAGGGSLRSLAQLDLLTKADDGTYVTADRLASATVPAGQTGDADIELLCSSGPVCWLCSDPGSDVHCGGGCDRTFHAACLGMMDAPKKGDFRCDRCTTAAPECLHCSQAQWTRPAMAHEPVDKCAFKGCSQAFHSECALAYEASQPASGAFVCPLHRCTRCLKTVKTPVRCIRCPTVFHKECVPLGSREVDAQHVVCARHLERKVPKNIEYCVMCGLEGDLVCCDGCVAAVHTTCIKLDKAPQDKWFCLDCLTRSFPAYGDVAMVKYGNYRMWPVRLCAPADVPEWLQQRAHKPTDVVIEFLGTRQYAYVPVATVMPYNANLLAKPKANPESSMERQYKSALEEAQQQKPMEAENVVLPTYSKAGKNVYVPPCRPEREVVPPEALRCFCASFDTHCESQCLNRLSLIECTKQCEDPLCMNKRMQNRQAAKVELFYTGNKGWGVRTRQALSRGDFVLEYTGEVIDLKTCAERLQTAQDKGVQHYYFLTLHKDAVIDASSRGGIARFINHSCAANCETQKWLVNGYRRIGIFAKEDIAPGTELSFDYQYDALIEKRQKCFCGAPVCSGFIGERKVALSASGKPKTPGRRKAPAMAGTRKRTTAGTPTGTQPRRRRAKQPASPLLDAPMDEPAAVSAALPVS